jgi:hypothetical protein
LLALALLLAACPGAVDAPRPRAATPDPEGPRFDVAIDAPASAIAGQANAAKIQIVPRAPWHMNLDYSPKLRMDATGGVELDTRERRGPDASRFDDAGLAFEVPFTPRSKGKQRIAGELQFAVCGAEACAPQSVPVDFTVDVACDKGTVC